ncbi:MAG: pyruvate dehydrogenase (acetyl-transferring) E1 component subunit alpha [Alicyclobacillaceae bacterium]|nr:pyruvate dehydrogenase (acetyl-transferring) E1 component subunit alpha [Alicyclobacillaceae bacterium]
MIAENELSQLTGFFRHRENDVLPLFRVVQPDGKAEESMLAHLTVEQIQKIYRQMVRVRQFDRKSIALQRQGKMGTYAPFEGQEAAQVGSALALRRSDWVFPTYRDGAASMTHGMPLKTMFRYWMGQLDGFDVPDDLNILHPCVPIATHLLHAVGVAWAAKLRGEDTVSICYFGDGATSEGDFHEALNFAGVFHLPVVFFCQNNGFAISVPFQRQSASRTIAERASAYAMDGIRVDGNDGLAVYLAVQSAVQKARDGGGPTLIEAVTQRFGAHTTADDPTRYRDQASMDEAWRDERDGIVRLRCLMLQKGVWSDSEEQRLLESTSEELLAAFDEAAAVPMSQPAEMFHHVYGQELWHLKEQRQGLQAGGEA